MQYTHVKLAGSKLKRQRIEIMAQILAFCIRERRKTRIMYGINLSHAQLKTFLRFLISRDLLAHNSDRFVTTQKGQRFLKAFARINDMLEDPARRGFPEAPWVGLGEIVNRPHVLNSQVGKRTRAKHDQESRVSGPYQVSE